MISVFPTVVIACDYDGQDQRACTSRLSLGDLVPARTPTEVRVAAAARGWGGDGRDLCPKHRSVS